MSGLLHDRPFRRPSNRRAGRMARPQRVLGVGGSSRNGNLCSAPGDRQGVGGASFIT
jgi:hypothetical protein